MRKEKLHYLLYRAAAALETPGDLSEEEKKHLAEDLALRAQEIEGEYEHLWENSDGE